MERDPKLVQLVLDWARSDVHGNESVKMLADEVERLQADNERLRAMRHHDLNAWKYDPNGPVA